MREIDLHVHTTASDGTTPPEKLVRLAEAQGLRAVAITDHDTVHGYVAAARAGKACGVEPVPGRAISTKVRRAGHILL